VFTARYGLSPYITQICFFFKRSIAVFKVQHTAELKHATAMIESYKKTSHYVRNIDS
jgi:hypothetical protein